MEKQQQEFSFNIVSLHSNLTNPTASASPSPHTTSSSNSSDRHDPKSSSSAIIDLSPADEIFFHGHLLPLHLLSHFSQLLPSPRSSFSSLHDDDDTFTLPSDHHYLPSAATSVGDQKMNNAGPRQSRAFSMFGLSRRRRVHGVVINEEETGHKRRSSKLECAVKRCMRIMMNPSFLFRGRRRRRDIEFSPQNDSFSRNSSRRSFKLLARRRTSSSYYSAPTSGMTSPTNSGLLVGRPLLPSSDSTVEELQAAVQAAIVYCKRSIEVDDKEEDDENVGTIKSSG